MEGSSVEKMGYKLGEATVLKSVAIRVKDRDKMIQFYKEIVGFDLKREENELAIFGNVTNGSELLLLEESPRANAHEGERRKMAFYTLYIPTAAELAAVTERIRQAEYPIEETEAALLEKQVVLVDPEGNKLELRCGQEETADGSKEDFSRLSGSVHFEHVHLNVHELDQEAVFLTEVLGLVVKDERHRLRLADDKEIFQVGLTEASGGTISLPTDTVHGLDFLKFQVDEDSLLSLETHLKTLKQDFFIDKKKSVLTIYDAIGIEWWFVRN